MASLTVGIRFGTMARDDEHDLVYVVYTTVVHQGGMCRKLVQTLKLQ